MVCLAKLVRLLSSIGSGNGHLQPYHILLAQWLVALVQVVGRMAVEVQLMRLGVELAMPELFADCQTYFQNRYRWCSNIKFLGDIS
jgi:hypothetical protein